MNERESERERDRERQKRERHENGKMNTEISQQTRCPKNMKISKQL